MKTLLFTILLLVSVVTAAFAVDQIKTTSLFTAQTTTGVSSAVNTGLYTKKSVIINGSYTGGVYGNYSGTLLLQCAPTATGPWVTCKDSSGNAVSATTNTTFDLDTLVQYVRANWTKTKHNISVWLYYAK